MLYTQAFNGVITKHVALWLPMINFPGHKIKINNDQSHAILENDADRKRETINLLGVVLVQLSVTIKINTLLYTYV